MNILAFNKIKYVSVPRDKNYLLLNVHQYNQFIGL